MRSDAPALMPIFRSQHQGELLAKLLMDETQEYTLSELARELEVPLATLQREAQRLAVAGLIKDRKQGRNRLVSANPANPATGPLTALVMLSFGPHAVIAEEFALEDVQKVVIFGSWAARYAGEQGPPPNDIDVLVIGDDVGKLGLYAAAERAEKRIGKSVNPVLCSTASWQDPGDWALVVEIQHRPYTTVFTREDVAA